MKQTILGKRIRDRLQALNKTQGWLAGEMELSDNAVSKWIRGDSEPTLSNLKEMARLLKCSSGYLCGDSEDDDVAAITEMAVNMLPEARRYYRKSGTSLVEPEPVAKPKSRR